MYIYKAGDVIPAVDRVELSRRTGEEKEFAMIKYCPMCGTELVQKPGMVDFFCENVHCPARKIEGLIHFVSRNAMNIFTLGDVEGDPQVSAGTALVRLFFRAHDFDDIRAFR